MSARTEPVATELDARKPTHIAVFGKKGSGKSVLASRYWHTYPYDRLAIDPTGDALVEPDCEELKAAMIPDRWPVDPQGERVSLRYVGDAGSPTHVDDLDRCVGLAFRHPDRRSLTWIDEVGELTSANKTPPNMKRLLQQGRHRGCSAVFCGPRPMHINPLVLSQADLVYVFDTPNPADRDRIAAAIGWPPKHFDAAVQGLGRFEYLLYDSQAGQLTHLPALPPAAARPPRKDDYADQR